MLRYIGQYNTIKKQKYSCFLLRDQPSSMSPFLLQRVYVHPATRIITVADPHWRDIPHYLNNEKEALTSFKLELIYD